MAPLTIAKVRKLVSLKMPDAELRPYRRELIELHLDFLVWDWNCVSATICKEIIDKNRNKRDDLRGNPMLCTIDHWMRDLEPCAREDDDFMFEKNNVKIIRAEEFTLAPLFKNARSRTNEWKTTYYKDPKRRVITSVIMHILRLQRTNYVTAWQSAAVGVPANDCFSSSLNPDPDADSVSVSPPSPSSKLRISVATEFSGDSRECGFVVDASSAATVAAAASLLPAR
ncbi:hypothetical protein AXG93_339s1040 [Marchantia polymorpha subsp. ruderalis]|uniref:Uncharacterized protein n=1 Tax=Marchantia polymorpha subsp. ruderalis TaxID=1480154 RepID=A0A176WCK2_MARPO|nr:hypothetical protein AXG93_339s1040 [Marchantia polymorpha subsp. ruderalis]